MLWNLTKPPAEGRGETAGLVIYFGASSLLVSHNNVFEPHVNISIITTSMGEGIELSSPWIPIFPFPTSPTTHWHSYLFPWKWSLGRWRKTKEHLIPETYQSYAKKKVIDVTQRDHSFPYRWRTLWRLYILSMEPKECAFSPAQSSPLFLSPRLPKCQLRPKQIPNSSTYKLTKSKLLISTLGRTT